MSRHAVASGAGIPRRELVTLIAYVETGSHKTAAHRLGISESTARQRTSALIRRLRVRNVAQAAWALRVDLEREIGDAAMATVVTNMSASGTMGAGSQSLRRSR